MDLQKNNVFFSRTVLLLLLAACTLEASSMVHMRANITLASWVHFGSGLAIGALALLRTAAPLPQEKYARWVNLATYGLLLIGFGVLVQQSIVCSQALFAKFEVDIVHADMLPIMKTMSQRFLDGKPVYDIIPEIWGGMQPIYLPTMWMPYIPAVIWGFDVRWTTLFFILGGLALVMFLHKRGTLISPMAILVFVPLFFLFQSFLKLDTSIIHLGDEGVVIGWYLLLACALWWGNAWAIGTCIALAILCRFGVLFWIPAMIFWYWRTQSRTFALQVAGSGFILGLILMVVSGALFHLDVFAELPARYMKAIMETEVEKLRPTIKESLGLVKFNRHQDIPLFFNWSKVVAVTMPALLLGIGLRYRHRLDVGMFGLATLKICMVMFLNFLVLPVHMLFYTSCFVSIAVFLYKMRRPTQGVST